MLMKQKIFDGTMRINVLKHKIKRNAQMTHIFEHITKMLSSISPLPLPYQLIIPQMKQEMALNIRKVF